MDTNNMSNFINVDIDSNIINKDKTLNIELIRASLNYIDTYGKQEYNDAMQGMMALSNAYSEVLYDCNVGIQQVLKIIEDDPTSSSLSALSVVSSIQSGINKISSTISSATSSLKNMVSAFDPTNLGDWANLASKIASFLSCPYTSFLGDLISGFKSIKNGINDIRSGAMLNQIKNNLTAYVKSLVPSQNSLMSFVKDVASYVGIDGANIDLLIDVVGIVLRDNNLTMDYLRNLVGKDMQSIFDYIDPNSNYNKNRVKNNTNSSNNSSIIDSINKIPSTSFPTEIETIRCSFLAKIIQQLSNSYRENNRYDDIILLASMNPKTSNPTLNALISNYTNYGSRVINSNKALQNAISIGNPTNTSLSTTLSAIVTNSVMFQELQNNLSNVNEDKAKFYTTTLAAVNNLTFLLGMNNGELVKQKAFREGLNNIMRASDVMNISKTLTI